MTGKGLLYWEMFALLFLLRVLDVGFEPLVHFPKHVHDAFARPVAVALVGEHGEADGGADALLGRCTCGGSGLGTYPSYYRLRHGS